MHWILLALFTLFTGCTGSTDGMRTKHFPPDDTDTAVSDTDTSHDTATDSDSDTDTGVDTDTGTDTDTAPDECANAAHLCGMDLDDQIELRGIGWGVGITTQNESSGYDWTDPSDVARGIAVGGLFPPVPDFPDTTVYPAAYDSATDILNSTYGWGWCCSTLDWPAEYDTPEYVTIHHTAGRFDDVTAYVEYVYNFHTFGEDHGWGDIGYQGLIGRDADDDEIHHFEGRYSGDSSRSRNPWGSINVVGACVANHNTGNTCIAAIGDYSTSPPDAETFAALEAHTARVFYETGLTDTSHLIGHRDWDGASTECPGQALYDLLPTMRAHVDWCQNTCGLVPPPHMRQQVTGSAMKSSHEAFGDE